MAPRRGRTGIAMTDNLSKRHEAAVSGRIVALLVFSLVLRVPKNTRPEASASRESPAASHFRCVAMSTTRDEIKSTVVVAVGKIPRSLGEL